MDFIKCQVFLTYYKNTFRQGVSNDGGSHVEMSSICVVPLGGGRNVYVGGQAQPLLINLKIQSLPEVSISASGHIGCFRQGFPFQVGIPLLEFGDSPSRVFIKNCS